MANKKEKPQQLPNEDLQKMLEEQSAVLELMKQGAAIEAALEKVRARTMAMFKSEELNEVVFELFNQMKPLGFAQWGCTIMLADETNEGFNQWLSSPTDRIPRESFHVPKINHPVFDKLLSVYTNQLPQLTIEVKGTEKYNWDLLWFEKTDFKKTPQSVKDSILVTSKVVFSTVSLRYGLMIAIDDDPIPDKMIKILSRFAKVFEQTYTRFLDLQKAEAQAWEAKIQLAMERVRARTMAMQRSEELADVAEILFKQVHELGFQPWAAGFNIWQEGDDSYIDWVTNPSGGFMEPYTVDLTTHPVFRAISDAKKRGEDFHVFDTSGEVLEETYALLMSFAPKQFGETLASGITFPTRQINHYVYSEKVGLMFITSEPVPEAHDIFKRFGKVFEQTYTRFLDLQNAEAQAREAQIEAALERVRTVAMSMMKSEDLLNVCESIYVQLNNLGFTNLRSSQIYILNDASQKLLNYDYFEHLGSKLNEIKYGSHEKVNDFIRDIRNSGETLVHSQIAGTELDNWRLFLSDTLHQGKEPRLEEAKELHYYHYSIGNGALSISAFKKISGELQSILKRLWNVFSLSYKRYSDIALAEAQAREAHIEAALERVRSRTMAMQRSAELAEVATVLFQQVKALGVQQWTCGFSIFEIDDKEFIWYPGGPGGEILPPCKIPLTEHPVFISFNESRKRGDELYIYEKTGEAQADHYRYMCSLPEIGEYMQSRLDAGDVIPAFQIDHLANFSHGNLIFITYEHFPEMHDIFKRFAKVFEQTYTRFLDLQNAEEQARESQIQLALERVRARTMAMQKSDELPDAALLLSTQVKELGVQLWSTSFQPWDNDRKAVTAWTALKDIMLEPIKIPATEDFLMINISDAAKKGELLYVEEMGGKVLENHLKYMNSLPGVKEEFEKVVDAGFSFPTFNIFHAAYFSTGFILFITEKPYPEAHDIFKRFAKVFEQTYTRFLDLQKAEAQAREAQIELGLERVRARAMAMQKSDELSELVDTVFKELTKLDFALTWCIINIIDESSMSNTVWATNRDINKAPESYHMLFEDYPFHHAMMKGWKEKKTKSVYTLEGDEKRIYDDYLFSETEFKKTPEAAQAASRAMEKYVCSFSFSNFGGLQTVGDTPLSEANLDILSRFGKVFDLTYTRFNDLQKAEAQAREAQIEASLERVRSRSMGMQKSEELKEVIQVVYEQFVHLNIKIEHTGFVMDYKERDDYDIWIADPLGVPSQVIIPYFDCVYYNRFNEAKEKGEDFFATNLSFEEKNRFYQKLFEYVPGLPEEAKEFYFSCPGLAASTVLLENVCLYIENFSGTSYSDEENNTLMRFGKVFQQTYTRFLDLQKAEAQAREAKIEAALERVRTQSMLMQHSNELNTTLQIYHQQLQLLGINSDFSFLWLPDEENDKHIFWATWEEEKNNSTILKSKALTYTLDRNEFYTAECLAVWKSGELVHAYKIPPAEVKNYCATWQELLSGSEKLKPELFPNGLDLVEAYMKYGCFGIFINRLLTEDEKQMLRRFTIEFERAYTRFLDLQKAEAQAREAQIEAALERVRSRTLAMHKSDELAETAVVLFQQLIGLGIEPNRLYIGIIKDESGNMEMWATDEDGTRVGTKFMFNKNDNDSVKKLHDGWQAKKKSVVVNMQGKELEEYFHYLNSVMHIPFKGGLIQKRRVQSVAYFSQGLIGMASPDEQTEESIQLLERFASVFNLTYTRFNDLQHAEAQTHKANIEVALERVRARALAMQQPEELVEVAEVLRHEMGLLGVEELETSSIYIHDENSDKAECWYAITDIRMPEKKLIADHITIALQETWVGRQMFDFYNSNKKQISIPMLGTNRKEWIDYCSKVSTVFEGFYGETIADRTYHLYKFSNGAIAAATPGDISAESWELLQRAASVFSLAYSRFKDLTQARFDLQQLKAEKQRAEEALTELQATQKQLIQSEKMASLGELTAGIAHEIQNPLNFVNNFSEVSKELLDEMKIELDNGNMIDAKDIANDVIHNLEKINHHGKRADAIVKGMLQHSQASTGQKEPTDINKLVDEYLRLSYHGLRAKDNTFNATLKTDFDETIEMIDIVPQEVGRVMLNLFNNAFYATNEKKKTAGENYKPLVSVQTKKINNKIEIRVSDNGNGIPQKIVDKIFQPFFTTKPTGQGTGLGLSLSYDIVKAHGGELKVETIDGEGSTFSIELPLNQN